ncbi:MAG: O-antigen ligase family protein, partial [Patescibacteria group bacterium]|nr:O-antigen ligase family protein [Patescibacteria group bacterium]
LFYFFSNNLTYDGRLSGFYISPNYLAMCLSPVLILSLWLYFCLEKQLFKVFLFTGQCLLLATVFLTYSYSAWAGLAAALLFVSVFQKLSSRNSVSGWKPSFCVLLIIISFFFSQINSPKFQELLDFSYPSLSSRLAIWQSAGEIIKDHPLNGIGPGLFQKYYLDKQTDFGLYPEWAVPQPHNLFLAFWLQTGLIGLIGFIWLMVSFFKSGFKALFGIRHSLSAVFLMAAMVYILTHGLTDTTYWKNDLSIVFWLVLALSRNNRKKYKGSPFREIQGQPF